MTTWRSPADDALPDAESIETALACLVWLRNRMVTQGMKDYIREIEVLLGDSYFGGPSLISAFQKAFPDEDDTLIRMAAELGIDTKGMKA